MTDQQPSPLKKTSRSIPSKTSIFLYVQAGGRCEFDGCNKYLLEHYPTETPGNFAEQAHIYAFSESGSRGAASGRPKGINSLSNLMLLCPGCHHLVDSVEPASYPVEVLRKFKRDHEDRIFWLTELSKDRGTVPLVIKGLVKGRPVDISEEEMQAAVAPNFLRRREKIEIDLTAIPDSHSSGYWEVGTATIDRQISRLMEVEPESGSLRISVFGLAAIPLLVHLGCRLSDKVKVDLYQRHRNPESWKWREGPGNARFDYQMVSKGTATGPMALLLNLSGKNPVELVHSALGSEAGVYELTLVGQEPSPLFLCTRDDLTRFSETYIRLLSSIRASHPHLKAIHVFPAIPGPVAIALGRTRLPKVDPALVIWDRDSRAGGFTQTLEIQ